MRHALPCLTLPFLLGAPLTPAAPAVGPETFARLHQELQPPEEAWTSIPWHSSLIPGQQLAAAEGKPLFIWAMDGHPMGCT